MHERAADFRDCAEDRYGFEPEIVEFPEGTQTAADAAAAVGCTESQIASSLVFDVDGTLVVCLTSGANHVDEGALGRAFDASAAEIEMATPARVRAEIGWTIGGVPPICHESVVPVVMDQTLLENERVWAAAGTPSAVFPTEPAALRSMTGADPIDVTGDDLAPGE